MKGPADRESQDPGLQGGAGLLWGSICLAETQLVFHGPPKVTMLKVTEAVTWLACPRPGQGDLDPGEAQAQMRGGEWGARTTVAGDGDGGRGGWRGWGWGEVGEGVRWGEGEDAGESKRFGPPRTKVQVPVWCPWPSACDPAWDWERG